MQNQWKELKESRRRGREQYLFPITIFHVAAPAKRGGKVSEERERGSATAAAGV